LADHRFLRSDLERCSAIPGRVRWQINNYEPNEDFFLELKRILETESGIRDVTTNFKTRRILVLYDTGLDIGWLETVILESQGPRCEVLIPETEGPENIPWQNLAASFLHSPQARQGTLLSFGAALLSAIRIYALGSALNGILRTATVSPLALLAPAVLTNLAVVIVGTTLHIKLKKAGRHKFKQYGLEQEKQIRLAISNRLLHADLSALESQSKTDLANSIRTNLGQIERGFDGASELIDISANTAVLITLFLSLAPKTVWLPVLAIAAMGSVVHKSYKDTLRQYDKADRSRNESDRVLTEMTEGLATVKSYGLEEHFLTRVAAAAGEREIVVSKSANRTISYPLEMELITLLGDSAVTVMTGLTLAAGAITPGTHLILMLVAGHLFFPFSNIGQPLDSINRGIGSHRILKDICSLPLEKQSSEFALSEVAGPLDIEFRDVNFTYPGGRGPTLTNINLQIREGKIVGVVGESGSGKSTLVRLLQRFYTPAQGNITIAGNDIQEMDHIILRSLFACVDQRSYLFEGSIQYNIGLGSEKAGLLDIENAAKSASIHSFVDALPDKYNTQIGVNGSKLSDGQRQRILLARSFLRGAPVLVLDEGTANLDMATEQEILSNIKAHMLGHTVIVVAHHLPAIQDADTIVVMKAGKIVEIGDHNSLVAKNGAYLALLNSKDWNAA